MVATVLLLEQPLLKGWNPWILTVLEPYTQMEEAFQKMVKDMLLKWKLFQLIIGKRQENS